MTRKPKSKELPDWDDGRTIVDMNVEGMDQFSPLRLPSRPRDPGEKKPEPVNSNGLTKKQVRMYTMSAMKAGLLIATVMSLFLTLFTLFCVFVWFR